jgi:hypothetical protein
MLGGVGLGRLLEDLLGQLGRTKSSADPNDARRGPEPRAVR